MRANPTYPILLLLAASLPACGGGGPSGTDDQGKSKAPDVVLVAGPFHVPSGGEEVLCSFFRLRNDEPIDVQRLVARQTRGGHHLIAYAVDHPINSGPIHCSQGGQPGWSQLFVTQLSEQELELPRGIGLHLGPHQQMVLETHFINTSSSDIDVSGTVELYSAPVGSVQEEAAPFFFGSTNIDIPPNGQATSGATCSPPDDIHLLHVFGHEHRNGTGVRMDVGPRGGKLDTIYSSTSWEAPPVKDLDMQVGPGSAVRVRCDWENSSSARLVYPDEMCFAIGMYWPSHGQLFCVTTGGSSDCRCFYMGISKSGPGGAAAHITVGRRDDIPGVKGDPRAGNPIYCRLFRPEDWTDSGPSPGQLGAYSTDVEHVPLQSVDDRAELTMQDVTPGRYHAFCYMDTIGGGFFPGSGDPVAMTAEPVEIKAGQTAQIDLVMTSAAQ
jgi:hypothetical protein